MADICSVLTPTMDISKLKVPDLKKELKSRGLSTSGNKNELVERLVAALKSNEHISNESVSEYLEEDLLNEDDDDVHLESTESVISDIDTALNDSIQQPKVEKRKSEEIGNGNATEKPPAKKVVLNRNTPIIADIRSSTESNGNNNEDAEAKKVIKLSEISAKERLEMRAKKFDVSLSAEARKIARAERFGTTKNNKSNSAINTKVDTSSEVLKKRAERFGVVSKAALTLDTQEKLEKRKARFGIVTSEDKAKQRLERFKESVK